jgi:hypothetical protein
MMLKEVGLDDEDTLLKKVLLHAMGMKHYFCGFDECKSREHFDSWKHVQQHYKNYHKATVKKKESWNESVPKIREVDVTEELEDNVDSEQSPRNKRKRSVRTDVTNKVQKMLDNESPVLSTIDASESSSFGVVLTSSTVLAKVTEDFALLKDQIKNAVLPDHQDPSLSSSVNSKLADFDKMKLSIEQTIEEYSETCGELSPVQRELIDKANKSEGKKLVKSIAFAKWYLFTLQLSELRSNPEYIALLALHDILENVT